MTSDIKPNEDTWQQTISAFHVYLEQSMELLAQKQEITNVDAPSLQNPRIAASRKPKKIIPATKISTPAPMVSDDLVQAAFKLSKTKAYSSPLWVGLGDESIGLDNGKARRRKKKPAQKKKAK